MTILHLCRLYAPHIGGVETHVSEVNQMLIRQGYQVMVITEQFDSSLRAEEIIDGVTIIRIPREALKSKLGIWRWMWSHRAVFDQVDIIQVHDVFWWLWPVLPLVEDKVYTTFHGWETQFPVRWQAKVQRWVVSQCSQATVHVGDWIREFYWDRPSLVTYGGVGPVSKKTVNIPAKFSQLVFIGRLSRDNGVDHYLQLVKLLKKENRQTTITWIGDGEMRQACAEIGPVTGFVADPQPYLLKADAVFAASYLALLQVQALGKLVCSFYSNKLKERYLETYPGSPYLLMSSDAEDMAAQLQSLADNKDQLRQMLVAGQEYAQDQTWEKVTTMYIKLWQL